MSNSSVEILSMNPLTFALAVCTALNVVFCIISFFQKYSPNTQYARFANELSSAGAVWREIVEDGGLGEIGALTDTLKHLEKLSFGLMEKLVDGNGIVSMVLQWRYSWKLWRLCRRASTLHSELIVLFKAESNLNTALPVPAVIPSEQRFFMTSNTSGLASSQSQDSNSNRGVNKPVAMDHNTHSYIAVTFAPHSPYMSLPASLTGLHSAMTYEGQVGALDDTHLYSVPKGEGESALEERDDVLSVLEERGPAEGIVHYELQRLQQRARRDEL
ncbi:hypothetical protein CVT24_000162 [Panaeolus cyanescens]|uniref:Uncharacterized protein n=1 Tax=Panaeolus cyanescens TaxID=181874 RepID=A0A409VIW8_9AGAR|nr:hypothetical protein CVT24_000162 [Panaeolus cyanescens]